ncbi:MAG: hypothetical protein V1659_05815 [Candidatus Woesearchaeota archaeon]
MDTKTRIAKKGFYFSVDAFFAAIIIIISLLLLLKSENMRENTMTEPAYALADDALHALDALETGELEAPFAQSLVYNNISDPGSSVLEQIASFYAENNYKDAGLLAEAAFSGIEKDYFFRLFIDGKQVYASKDFSAGGLRPVSTATGIVSALGSSKITPLPVRLEIWH